MTANDPCASRAQQNKEGRASCRASVRRGQLLAAAAMRCVLVVLACASPGASIARAQPEVSRCGPPEAPMTDLPVEVLVEYRAEIAAEFEAYFVAISEHIACLDAERARAMIEARVATEAYTRLINTIPLRKAPP